MYRVNDFLLGETDSERYMRIGPGHFSVIPNFQMIGHRKLFRLL